MKTSIINRFTRLGGTSRAAWACLGAASTPSWVLPAGACDSQFHVFGPPHLFPYADTRRYTPPAAPIEHYWNVQQITGLSRAVVVQPTAHGVDNRAALDAIARSKGAMRGIGCIDGSISDAQLDELASGGMLGARFSEGHVAVLDLVDLVCVDVVDADAIAALGERQGEG